MASSGAIPKVKGGARPKTKSLANGGVQNGVTSKPTINNFTLNPKNLPKIKNIPSSLIEDFSISTQTEVSQSQPLDKREIHITDDGVEVKRPGLSPEWVEKRTFIHYTRPPVEGEYVVGAVDAWVEQMEFLLSDLTWLLGLPYHKFWSQVVFDESVHECLQYYLMEGPRWYDTTIFTKDETCVSLLNSIHQLVFLIFVRMATFKESKNDHITPSIFGDLIYDNFIYDICKILDLCILYGSSNGSLLERLISSIFTHQPKYFNDLTELSLSLFSVLKNLEEKLGVSEGTLVLCSLASEESKVSLEELGDVIDYMMDCFCSLQAFLTIFPKACETFHEKDLELRLSSFYERAVPKLVDHLSTDKEMQREELAIKCELKEKLDVVRLSILTIFREILTYICLPTKVNTSSLDAKTLSEKIESFSHILTSSVEEKIFITDYNATYDLSADIFYFKEKGADLTTLTFIKEAVESIVNEVSSTMAVEEGEEVTEGGEKAGKDQSDTSGMNGYYAGQTNSLSPVEVESLVSGVQDLFPELGSGFIKECLRYYSFSGEEVLNAILEDNLPPCLDAMDRSMKETLESSTSSSSRSLSEESSQNSLSQREKLPDNLVENQEENYDSGTLSNRLNIYDDDEFDVFRKPTRVKKDKIHKGKAAQARNLYEKDPELTQKMKSIVEQYEWNHGYSIYEDELKYTPLAGLTTSEADYDDEYDDTYADNEAGDVDNFPADGRRFERIPTIWGRGALNTPSLNFVDEEEDDEETHQEESEFHIQGQMGEPGGESFSAIGKEKSQYSEGGNFKAEKFKRANASQRRVYADREDEWNSSQTLSFTNSNRGRGGPRRNVSFREDNPNISEMNDHQQGERNSTRPSFEPFCENPEDARRRMERRRQNKQFRNKGYYQSSSGGDVGSEDTSNNSTTSYSQKSATKTNKHSGKSWRQGGQESDDGSGRKQHGGKYKEDTNHGKAQDRNFRHKMIHKNEQRRNAAQAKYRSNF